MGRKKVELTPEQIAERKQRYWGPERNLQRRDRYQTDQAYREQIIQQVRDSYRKQREEQGLQVRDEDCRENLGLLPEIAQTREVILPTGEVQTHVTLTVEELADLMQRNTQVMYRWMNAGMFPRPVFVSIGHRGRKQGVFIEEEVRNLVDVFGRHQESSQYYRNYHDETRAKLFGAVRVVRERMGVHDDGEATEQG